MEEVKPTDEQLEQEKKIKRRIVFVVVGLFVWYLIGALHVYFGMKEEEIYTGTREGKYGMQCSRRYKSELTAPHDGVGLQWEVMLERPDILYERPGVKRNKALKLYVMVGEDRRKDFEIGKDIEWNKVTVLMPVKKEQQYKWNITAESIFKNSRWGAVPSYSFPYGFTLKNKNPTVLTELPETEQEQKEVMEVGSIE